MTTAKHPRPLPYAVVKRTARLSGRFLLCSHDPAFPCVTSQKNAPSPKTQGAKSRLSVRGRETRFSSGGFLCLDGLRINNIRPDLREEFQPMPRNPVLRSSPLGHGAGSHPGKFRYSRCTAKRVDNFVCIHVVILAN